MSMSKRQLLRGFTLIEVIIFIVVVGAGLAGILSVSTTSIKSSADPLVRKQALAIAESLLEEIVLKEFKDPNGGTNGTPTICTAGVGSRSLWTNVCEYNGYSSTGITDVQGFLLSRPLDPATFQDHFLAAGTAIPHATAP